MNNNIFFNKRLYRDALRQLRVLGWVYGIIAAVISVSPVFIRYFSYRASITSFVSQGAYLTPSTITSLTPMLLVFMFVGGITLVMKAFSFLQSRAASDCWHSLPGTRVSTAVSLMAAVLTWIYAVIAATVLVTWGAYALTGLPLNESYIAYLLLANAAGATLVAAAALMAVSVTGTAFSGFVVTGLIVYLPRFMLLLYARAVAAAAPIAYVSDMGLLGNPAFHLPSALTFAFLNQGVGVDLTDMGLSDVLLFRGGIAYTAALAAVMLALGVLLYRARRSETAGRSAPNRILQHIYRCSLTLPVLLLGALLIISGTMTFELLITLLIVSLILYFCYELITTRRLRNLLTAAPLYLATAAVAAVFGVAARMSGDAILHTLPAAGDIAAVQIGVTVERGYPSYNQLLTGDIRYTDPEVKDILTEGLGKTIEFIDGGYWTGYGGEWGNYRLHLTDGSSFTRRIILTAEQMARLMQIQLSMDAYRNSYRVLPPDKAIQTLSATWLEEEAAARVWQRFRQEAEGLSDGHFSQVASTGLYMPGAFAAAGPADEIEKQQALAQRVQGYGVLTVIGNVGIRNFQSQYSLTNLTPEATTLYIAEYNRQFRESLRAQLQAIGSYQPPAGEDSGDRYSIGIHLYGADGTGEDGQPMDVYYYAEYYSYYDSPTLNAGEMERLLSLLAQSLDADALVGQPYMEVTVSSYLGEMGARDSLYLPVTEAQIQALAELFPQSDEDGKG